MIVRACNSEKPTARNLLFSIEQPIPSVKHGIFARDNGSDKL